MPRVDGQDSIDHWAGEGWGAMELTGWTGKLYRACEWIMNLAYINLLWILFTLGGLVVLGAWPATAAMFAVMRKWMHGEDVPVFSAFWTNYKQAFVKGNALGYLLLAFGLLLWFDLRWFSAFDIPFAEGLLAVMLVVGLLYVLMAFYLYPVYVHYEMAFFRYFRVALLLGMSHPFSTILMVVACGLLFTVFLVFPVLVPFFGISGCAVILSWNANRVLSKIEQAKEHKVNGE